MTELSIIISCGRGRTAQFKSGINSIYHQQADFDKVELLFLNDGGEKELYSILKSYSGKFKIRYFEITKKSKGPNHVATRRNFLVRNAVGKYILITDPEIVHSSNTISQVFTAFKKYGDKIWYCGSVWGLESFVNKKGELANYDVDNIKDTELKSIGPEPKQNIKINLDYYTHCHRYHPVNTLKYEPLMFCTALAKKYFERVRGFNEKMLVWGYEEVDLFARLKKLGLKRIFNNRFRVYHLPHYTTLTSEQRLSWNIYNESIPFINGDDWGLLKNETVKEISI